MCFVFCFLVGHWFCLYVALDQYCLYTLIANTFLRLVWNYNSHQIVLCDKVRVFVYGSLDMFKCFHVSSICLIFLLILAPYPHCNPTGVCWRLMPGPCQERHPPVHHLRVGKPWANGCANSSAHGWDVDAKFGQCGKSNGKSCGPFGPGQHNSRRLEWRTFWIPCCFRNASDRFNLMINEFGWDFLSTHKAVARQSWPTAGSEWVCISWHVEKSPSDVPWSRGRRKCVSHPCGIWPPTSEISASNWQDMLSDFFALGHADFHVTDFGLSFLHVAQIHRNLMKFVGEQRSMSHEGFLCCAWMAVCCGSVLSMEWTAMWNHTQKTGWNWKQFQQGILYC